MVRKNFFEVLNNIEIDPVIEMAKIEQLFSEKTFIYCGYPETVNKLIDKTKFLEWRYRGSCLTITDLRLACNIPFSNEIINCSVDTSFEDMFLYFEFILNMLNLLGTMANFSGVKEFVNLIEYNIKFLCLKYIH